MTKIRDSHKIVKKDKAIWKPDYIQLMKNTSHSLSWRSQTLMNANFKERRLSRQSYVWNYLTVFNGSFSLILKWRYKNCEDHSHAFQAAVLIHKIQVLTSYI